MAPKKKSGGNRPTKAQIAAREARERQERRNKRITAGVVAAVAVVLVIVGVATSRGKNQKASPIAATANPGVTCTTDTKSDAISDAGPHVNNPKYEVDPPAGGDHKPEPAAPGIYDAGKVDVGKAVHSLEHGYVAIWYRPGISDADLAVVENVWKNYKRDVLVIEHPSLPADTPVVATAWHNRLLCSGADGARLNDFVRSFVNNGPEKIPHTVPPAGRDPRT